MRVLFLSREHDFTRSGSAHAFRLDRLRQALDRDGIETDFLSLREQPFSRPSLVHPLNLPMIRNRLATYDFIHAACHAAYSAALAKPFLPGRVIYDVHGNLEAEARLALETRPSLRTAFELIQARLSDLVAFHRSDYFLVVSQPLRRRLLARRISQERIALIRNGVDLKLFHPNPCPNGNGFTVAYAGGFQRWQGIETLVSAFERLRDDPVRLQIIGFTDREAALRAGIARRLGDKADLVGRLPQHEVASRLASAQMLVLPRPEHPAVAAALPTKFGEYLAVAKPVLVCNVDETATLVREHHCGFVSEPGPAALATAIRVALQLPRSVLGQMGQRARRLAESGFSWEDIGRAYTRQLQAWAARP